MHRRALQAGGGHLSGTCPSSVGHLAGVCRTSPVATPAPTPAATLDPTVGATPADITSPFPYHYTAVSTSENRSVTSSFHHHIMNSQPSSSPPASEPDLKHEVADLQDRLQTAESAIVELAAALERSWKFARHQARLHATLVARIAAINSAIIPTLSSATEREPLSVAVELDQVAAMELEEVILKIGDFSPLLAEFFDPRLKLERDGTSGVDESNRT